MRVSYLALFLLVGTERGWPPSLPVDLWEDVTESTIGVNSYWTNMVELADVNEDGLVDVLSAIGAGNDDPQPPEFSRIYLNQGPRKQFREATEEIFGPRPLGIARVIKVRDVNDDGHADIIVGLTFETESRLFLGRGQGQFFDATETHFPRIKASVDDLELGDMDGDGDLDIVLCVWGSGNPKTNEGGRTRLWLNDGEGRFTDATETHMPERRIKFPWELELVDIDNDYDLDVLVAPWKDQTSYLFENDGHGKLADVTEGRLPLSANNFDFEAMDLTGDGYLDLITINTGELLEGPQEPRRNQILVNDRRGGFVDASPELWPDEENSAYDDNTSIFLDYDSDGDADVLIAALTGPDRLLINDATGRLKEAPGVFPNQGIKLPPQIYPVIWNGKALFGCTLYISLADLDGDKKLDAAFAQGETRNLIPFGGFEDKIYFGSGIAPDTAPPIISLVEKLEPSAGLRRVRARVHDNKSPTMPHDWSSVAVRWSEGDTSGEEPMRWYGEYLWSGKIPDAAGGKMTYQVCATDAAGNSACSRPE
jgi:hypothetical protein